MPRGVALEWIQNVVSLSLEYTARAALAKAGSHAGCTAFSQTRALYDGWSCGNRICIIDADDHTGVLRRRVRENPFNRGNVTAV